MRDTHRERERERQRPRQREKQAPHREPDAGLDPGSPGSPPGLRRHLCHRGCPWDGFFSRCLMNVLNSPTHSCSGSRHAEPALVSGEPGAPETEAEWDCDEEKPAQHAERFFHPRAFQFVQWGPNSLRSDSYGSTLG